MEDAPPLQIDEESPLKDDGGSAIDKSEGMFF